MPKLDTEVEMNQPITHPVFIYRSHPPLKAGTHQQRSQQRVLANRVLTARKYQPSQMSTIRLVFLVSQLRGSVLYDGKRLKVT